MQNKLYVSDPDYELGHSWGFTLGRQDRVAGLSRRCVEVLCGLPPQGSIGNMGQYVDGFRAGYRTGYERKLKL